MSAFSCDLHIHSCLSPCADDDMTPHSIAGMAKVCNLEIAALTDHNACGNCASFFCACEELGVVPIAGMELTTSEDVHLLCLFPSCEDALSFERDVQTHRVLIPNRPDVFGRQLLMSASDEVVGEEEFLLINATDLMIESAAALVKAHHGACIPAHVDREGNGILFTLGDLPEKPFFPCVEYHDKAQRAACEAAYPRLRGKENIVSSDAHRLWEIGENAFSVELPCQKDADADAVRRALIAKLRG